MKKIFFLILLFFSYPVMGDFLSFGEVKYPNITIHYDQNRIVKHKTNGCYLFIHGDYKHLVQNSFGGNDKNGFILSGNYLFVTNHINETYRCELFIDKVIEPGREQKTFTVYESVGFDSIIIIDGYDKKKIYFKNACVQTSPGSKAEDVTLYITNGDIRKDKGAILRYTHNNKSICSVIDSVETLQEEVEETESEKQEEMQKYIDPRITTFNTVREKYVKEQGTKRSMEVAKSFIFFYLKKKGSLGENEEVGKQIYKIFSDFIVEDNTHLKSDYTGFVNINTASIKDLKRIVHIDDERAQQIISLRPFTSVESLTRVSGIGSVRMNEIVEQGLASMD